MQGDIYLALRLHCEIGELLLQRLAVSQSAGRCNARCLKTCKSCHTIPERQLLIITNKLRARLAQHRKHEGIRWKRIDKELSVLEHVQRHMLDECCSASELFLVRNNVQPLNRITSFLVQHCCRRSSVNAPTSTENIEGHNTLNSGDFLWLIARPLMH